MFHFLNQLRFLWILVSILGSLFLFFVFYDW